MFDKSDIITGDAFKQICDDFIDESKPFIDITKKPKIIFCYTDWVELFISKVLPQIDYKFKLVTHNADRSVTANFLPLLEDSRLIRWYGMNCHIIHEKLTPIPIGIANEKWPHGDKNILLDTQQQDNQKDILVYKNFAIHTNYIERINCDAITTKNNIYMHPTVSIYDHWNNISKSTFVISPHGNSIDCHRLWECFMLHAVPVVKKHIALSSFSNLPILFIDKWEDVTIDFLKDAAYNFNPIKFDLEKASFKYWADLIKS